MKKLMVLVVLIIASVSARAQYNDDYDSREYNDDRYFYDDEFDWHWDIRVRISNGIDNGLITYNESQRLYSDLERIERKEYAYQEDGYYTDWEQQDVWNDVIFLNRRFGIELSDNDRVFYGFDRIGVSRRGFSIWFYSGGYDFYRFDHLGFGSIRLGYRPRPNYIRRHIYVHRHPVYRDRARDHFYGGSRGRSNNGRVYGNNDRGRNNPRGYERGGYNSGRNSSNVPSRNEGRNSRGSYGEGRENRSGRVENPRDNNSGGSYGNRDNAPSRIETPRESAPSRSESPRTMPRSERNNSGAPAPRMNRGSENRSRESAPQQRQGGSNERRGNSDEGRGRSGRRS